VAKFTKKAIVYGFLEILQKESLDKITVKDICERCDINRNTFYYYFEDIYDVLNTVFENEKDKIFKELENNTSYLEEYKKTASFILDNKKAVMNVYNSKRADILEDYLNSVIRDFVRKAVIDKSRAYELTEQDIDYISGFYSYAIVGITMQWISHGLPPYKDNFLNHVAKSFDMSIDGMIKSCL